MNPRKRDKKLRRRSAEQTQKALATFVKDTAIHGRRLTVLRTYAERWLPWLDTWAMQLARKSAVTSRRKFWAKHSGEDCFTGCGRVAEVAHHVIQIQHGGADISENKVPLCAACHADVHPWLEADTSIVAALKPFWG